MIILLLVVIVICITFFSIYKKNEKFEEEVSDLNSLEDDQTHIDEESLDVEENSIVMVHISGQVYKPGLIELESGARLIDAVNKAGGLKSEADIDRINLAKKLVDEEKIYIPKIGEEVTDIDSFSSEDSTTSSSTDKININNCSKEELMSLPGIGEALATRIIDYREESKFKSTDEIMNVSGIGNKKFESIREYITVN